MTAHISVFDFQDGIGCGTSAGAGRTSRVQDHNAVFIFDQRSVCMAVADRGCAGFLRRKGKMQQRAVNMILMTVDQQDACAVNVDDLLQWDGWIVIAVSADGYDAFSADALQCFGVSAVIAEVKDAVDIFGFGDNAPCGIDTAVGIGKN